MFNIILLFMLLLDRKIRMLFSPVLLLITGTILFCSCQKELDGVMNGGNIIPVNMKPRVGTKWTYRYYIYYVYGSIASASIIVYEAKAEETIAGEKWLKIVDVDTDTTAYYLNEKTGGLYQYTNNSSYLFCKDPAVVNETYNTFFEGGTEDFIVKGGNDTLPTGIGDVPVIYYEGYRATKLIDLLWYNSNAWIVRKIHYRKFPLGTVYYKYSFLFLDSIIY